MISQPPQSSRASANDRRKAIALAVRELIVEKGFENLRTREIADRVGINVATLHYHVPSKEALVELVARSIKDEFMARQRTAPASGLSPFERLEREFAVSREMHVGRPDQAVVLVEFASLARRDPKIAEVMDPMQRFRERHFCEILTEGRCDGSFRANLDPLAAARMLIGALNGFARLNPSERTAENFDHLIAELRRAIANPSTASKKS